MHRFKEALEQTDFRYISSIECPNMAYNEFLHKYIKLFDESFPLRDRTIGAKYFFKNRSYFCIESPREHIYQV